MTWGAVGGAAIGAVGSYMSASAGAGAAQGANAQNIQFQQQYNQQHDPFSTSGARAQYVPQLNTLMQGGVAGVANDPAFQAMNQNSLEGVDRMMASKGQGVGTNDLLALNQQNTLNQQSYFDSQYQRLASLSGASGGQSTVPQGMSPQTAGSIAMAPYQALGQGIGTLAGIYGNRTSGGGTSTQQPSGGGQLSNPFAGGSAPEGTFAGMQ